MIAAPSAQTSAELLAVDNLAVSFAAGQRRVQVLKDVSLRLDAGNTLGIVGESGCGKSVTSLAVIGLLGRGGQVDHGSVMFAGRDLLALPESQRRQVRGREIAMIFQDPMSSLNPVLTIGEQITEVMRTHQHAARRGARARAVELLQMVGIPAQEATLRRYPHEFSGGMRQRVMIATALALSPKLLIADEPTTALDVTIQAQVLDLMRRLVREAGAALMLVTHNLGVVAGMTERVAVMYAGRIVEEGCTADLFARPAHPYTVGLLHSLPSATTRGADLIPIPGLVPEPGREPAGCAFAPRCRWRVAKCWTEQPRLEEVPSAQADQPPRPGHRIACHNPAEPDEAGPGMPRRALPAAPAPPGITDFTDLSEAAS
jgi:oligopeptide/dipeptide ABC transporter ATP-binding protein